MAKVTALEQLGAQIELMDGWLTMSRELYKEALAESSPVTPAPLAFQWPIGTDEERASTWPGKWVDATGYAQRYQIRPGVWQIHTGGDFNLNAPRFDSDAHAKVYAANSGTVVFAGKGTGTWGNLVVIRHRRADGRPVWTRYAHLESYRFAQGQTVQRGEWIANIGNAGGAVPYHLHFDVMLIDGEIAPNDWPGDNLDRVKRDYLDYKLLIGDV